MSTSLRRTLAGGLTALTALTALVALVGPLLTAAPAEARLTVPVRCGDSSDREVVLRWDDVAYDVSGTCGKVRVAADDVTVSMSTARRLVVTGRRAVVSSKSVERLVVRGRRNHVSPTSVTSLLVTGRAARVRVEGLLDGARVATDGAVVTSRDAIRILVDGNRNRLRSGEVWTLRVRGDHNRGRFDSVDTRRVRGTGNQIVVR